MKMRIAAAAIPAIVFAGQSVAADLSYSGPSRGPAQLGGYSWTGPYVGANLGYQWASISNSPTNPSGFAAGIQAGYNWQMMNQFVFGVETDLQLSGADDVFAPWKFSNPWFGTLRGRVGYAMGNILFYGTVGLAYGGIEAQSTVTGISESRTHAGWALGGGMEVALTGRWTAKAEYLYVDLSSRNFGLTGMSNGLDSGLLRLGVNYRF
jgi:outer membrane immunogenic protein